MTNIQRTKLARILADYDKNRASEGYRIAYRREVRYLGAGQYMQPGQHVDHFETLYLPESPTGKSLLVKTFPDGSISAWEATS